MATVFQHQDGSESTVLPRELSLLISDCLEAPATFLVVQHIAATLKAKRPCVLVGLANSFDYYNAILRKQGIQLAIEREKGNFTYIDALSFILQGSESENALQDDLLDKLRSNKMGNDSLVIFDDYSGLLHAGTPPLELMKSFKKIQHTIRRCGGSLMVIYHDDAFSPGKAQITRQADDTFLLRNLIQLCDVWMQTRSLRAQLTGEVVVHRAPGLLGQTQLISHSVERPMQYKLEETGTQYFAKGTGKGFL